MVNNGSNAIAQRSPLARVARLIVGLVILFAVAGVLAAWFVNRYVVFVVEQGKGHTSVLVRTPLGSFPSRPSAANASTLWSAVHPKSEWDEENDTDFYRGTAGSEEKVAQLTVLRFRMKLSLVQADDWYRQQLSESFTRSKGWSPKTGEQAQEDWLPSVCGDVDPEALVYQQKKADLVRGVLLERQRVGSEVLATLYEFQEGTR